MKKYPEEIYCNVHGTIHEKITDPYGGEFQFLSGEIPNCGPGDWEDICIGNTAYHSNMMVFVWDDFCPDCSSGLAVAIARNETEARKQIVKQYGGEPYQWGEVKVYRVTNRLAVFVTGGC